MVDACKHAVVPMRLAIHKLSFLIRIAGLMKPVYQEILKDIKAGVTLHADETGWRVRGKNWWLWVFGTPDTTYFTVDKSRGSAVVRRVLGEIFFGVLVVDGWSAYLSLICEQQSCMAHVLRWKCIFRRGRPMQFCFRFLLLVN